MYLHTLIAKYLGEYSEYAWALYAAIAMLIALSLYWVHRTASKRLIRRLATTHKIWDDTFFEALRLPLSILIWFVAATLITQYASQDLNESEWMNYAQRIRHAGVIVLFVWFIWRYIGCIEQRLILAKDEDLHGGDKTTVSIIGRLLRIVLMVIASLMLMDSFGIPLTGLLAFGGGGAIAVGIAAQDLLANFFGGLMIFMDKPFKLGEWISSPDREIEGTVQEIGWRMTKVLTFDKRPLYIPNSVFSKITILNPDRMLNRRIKATIGLRYDDSAKLKAIIEDVRAMLHDHKGIDQSQALMVHFLNFGPSSLDIEIYCFTKTTIWALWRDIQQEVFLNALEIIAKHGAQAAFPTTTLHMPDGIAVRGDLTDGHARSY